MDTMVNQLEAEGFTRNQIDEIVKGKEAGHDVDIYTRKEFLSIQMQQIRLGLTSGIDLSAYNHLDAGILKQMRLAIMNHVNVVPYIIEGYDSEQLEAIQEALEKGLDI